jgi:peptidoglycan/LPS O-acetylase OafA/YrhL
MPKANAVKLPANQEARSQRDNTFDFLRLFAASIVVIAHAQADLNTSFLYGASQLFDGVGMFFILSGMLVYKSGVSSFAKTGRWLDFFRNRFLRIAPGIYSFAIVAPLMLVFVGAVAISDLFKFDMVVWLGSSLVLLPNYDPPIWAHVGDGVINGHLYTIPAEVSFYLVVPLLVILARKFGFRPVLIGMFAIGVAGPMIGHMVGGPVESIIHHTFIERAAFFAAGMFWAKYWGKVPVRWWLFTIALVGYFAAKIFALSTDALQPLHALLIAVPLSYVLVVIGYHGPKVLGRLTNRVGDLSFGTYIWHVLVIQLFIWAGWVGEWWQVLAVFAISWAVAFASWRLIERPALALKRISIHPA